MNKTFKDYTDLDKEFIFLKEKPNRILFLDIDGVINTPSTYFEKDKIMCSIKKEDKNSDILDLILASEKELLNNLQKILNSFDDIFICFCTSNRYSRTTNQLERLLKSYSLSNYLFLGATPVVEFEETNICLTFDLSDIETMSQKSPKYYSRGHEIQHILDYYKPNYYVVLDDMNDYLEEQQAHYVAIKGYLGLQECDVLRAIEILNIKNL